MAGGGSGARVSCWHTTMTKHTALLVNALQSAGQDFEWYPTTARMIAAVVADLGTEREDVPSSILDIGAGDGRVLTALAANAAHATLYAIEKSTILQQHQPDRIVPVGCDFHEQNLMALPVDVLFSNPPYSEFDEWAERIIRTAYARTAYLILPQRWESNAAIAAALKARDAEATIIHRDDFHDADRQARAVVHIVRVRFESPGERHWHRRRATPAQDPFDVWFDEHIDTFDREAPLDESALNDRRLARLRTLDSIPELVEAFNEEHARMEENYRAIFRLDGALLRELGVSKEGVRDGLKTKIAGLKHAYWGILFERLDVITSRLTTATKRTFLERLTGQTAIAFTTSNAYAVVFWAIRAANAYFDGQLVTLFRALSAPEGIQNYVSNQRTWGKDGWRYNAEQFSHYRLDYRIVLNHYAAIHNGKDFSTWDYPGNLHKSAHDTIADTIAVLGNLGFRVSCSASTSRQWRSNDWQEFCDAAGETVFEVKAFQNGNLHFRFRQDAIKALNIEAGRILGWVKSPMDVVAELGYSAEDAATFFGSHGALGLRRASREGGRARTQSGATQGSVPSAGA